jgi:hypothetical protein
VRHAFQSILFHTIRSQKQSKRGESPEWTLQILQIKLNIAFIDDDGSRREENHTIEASCAPDNDGEHRLSHILNIELRVMVGEQGAGHQPGVGAGLCARCDRRGASDPRFERGRCLYQTASGAEDGYELRQPEVTRVLEQIIEQRGERQSIQCDNGSELTSGYFLA